MRGVNRTIIIPKGTLNSDDINIVVVPPSLQNTSQPLIVRPTRGTKLAALPLPIWGDELDSSPVGKVRYETDLPPPTDSELPEDLDFVDFETSTSCATSPEGSPQLVHVSSRTVQITNDGPPEVFEMTFDASEGVDANVFETVIEQGVKEEKSYNTFMPQEVSSFDELNFSPIFNSTVNTGGGYPSSAAYYPAVRSSPPPSRGYRPVSGCGGGSCSGQQRNVNSSRYAGSMPYNDPYLMMQQTQQRQHIQQRAKRRPRTSRQPKQSGCGGGCSSGR